MSNVVGPIAAHRQEVLDSMPDNLKQIAVQMHGELTQGTRKAVIHFHRIGLLVDQVLSDDTNRYGTKAMEKLESYLNIKTAMLRNYREFARAFPDQAYVTELQNRPTATGLPLSVMHWIYASRVEDPRNQKAMIEKSVREGLTSNQLLDFISGAQDQSAGQASYAGRLHRPPSTPVAGVTKIGKLASKLDNYIKEVAEEHIFDPLANLSADIVTDSLGTTLQESRDRLAAVIESAQDAVKHLDKSIKRVTRIAGKKEEPQTPNDDAVDAQRENRTPVAAPTEDAAEQPKPRRGRPAKKTPV